MGCFACCDDWEAEDDATITTAGTLLTNAKGSVAVGMTSGYLDNRRCQPPGRTHGDNKHKNGTSSCVIASTKPLSPTSLAIQMFTRNSNDCRDRTVGTKRKPATDEQSTTDKLSMSYGLSQEGSDALSKPTYSFIYTNPEMMSSVWKGRKHRGQGKSRNQFSKYNKESPGNQPPSDECNLGPFVTAMCATGEQNRKHRINEYISRVVSLSGTIFSAEMPADFSGTVSPEQILPGSMKYKEDASNPSMLISRFKVDPTHLFQRSFESIETIPSVRSVASPIQNPFLDANDRHDEIGLNQALHSNIYDSHAEFSVHLKSFISNTSNRSSNVSEIIEDQGQPSDNRDSDVTSVSQYTI